MEVNRARDEAEEVTEQYWQLHDALQEKQRELDEMEVALEAARSQASGMQVNLVPPFDQCCFNSLARSRGRSPRVPDVCLQNGRIWPRPERLHAMHRLATPPVLKAAHSCSWKNKLSGAEQMNLKDCSQTAVCAGSALPD